MLCIPNTTIDTFSTQNQCCKLDYKGKTRDSTFSTKKFLTLQLGVCSVYSQDHFGHFDSYFDRSCWQCKLPMFTQKHQDGWKAIALSQIHATIYAFYFTNGICIIYLWCIFRIWSECLFVWNIYYSKWIFGIFDLFWAYLI